MKPYLLDCLQCDHCNGRIFLDEPGQRLACKVCDRIIPIHQVGTNGRQIPLYSQPPTGMQPSEKIERGPEIGTPWRQANWRFLQTQVEQLSSGSLILDVGAGRGDFTAALQNHRSVALEVYPYPEIDVVCDLTQTNPFHPASFDAILLLNVLEHIYDTHAMLSTLSSLLKPGGCLIMAIPFMVKIHQAPVDFVRYTHFALHHIGEQHGLQIDLIEGYYDPVFFLGEGIGNLKNSVLPELSGAQRRLANLQLRGIQLLANALQRKLESIGYRSGKTIDPAKIKSLAPTGYHVIYRRRK